MIQRSIILLCCGLCCLFMIMRCGNETPTSNTTQDQKKDLSNKFQLGASTQNQSMGIFGGSCITDWDYDPKSKGETHWPDLNPNYSLCGQGKSQSPINISTRDAIKRRMRRLRFSSNVSNIKVIHCGQAMRIDVHNIKHASGRVFERAFISLDRKKFLLDHIHIHTPSEHKIDNKHFPLEFHMVHKARNGEIAVIGVMVKAGKRHRYLAKFWDRLPELFPYSDGSRSIIVKNFNIKSLLPRRIPRTYRYDGSLTTPACNEGLRWLVTTEPIEMSSQQIRVYTKFFHTRDVSPFPKGNRRSVQPLNGRKVSTEIRRRRDRRYIP